MLNFFTSVWTTKCARYRHGGRERHCDGPAAREADAKDQHPDAGAKLGFEAVPQMAAEIGIDLRAPGEARRRQPAGRRSGRRKPPTSAENRTLPHGSVNSHSPAA